MGLVSNGNSALLKHCNSTCKGLQESAYVTDYRQITVLNLVVTSLLQRFYHLYLCATLLIGPIYYTSALISWLTISIISVLQTSVTLIALYNISTGPQLVTHLHFEDLTWCLSILRV